MKILDDQDVLRRARGDWARKSGRAFRPCEARHLEVDRLQYVVLFEADQVLVVYRVKLGRQLKRLKQWPAEVEDVLARDASRSPGDPTEPPSASVPVREPEPEASPATPLRDHPEMLGFRLMLMRWRAIAAKAGNEEYVRWLDAAIEVCKRS